MAPTVQQLREALAANLSASLSGIQVSAYMLANPTPPTIHLYPSAVVYDLAYGRGQDDWTFTVQAFVGMGTDLGAQQALDVYLAPSGHNSVKAAIESDSSLGGLVDDLQVVSMGGYHSYVLEGRPPVFGAEWQVLVIAGGA